MLYFILGAPDPEMQEIRRVLDAHGIGYAHATHRGRVVQAFEAYSAEGVEGVLPAGARLVFVECSVMGLRPEVVVDHHHEGDPGYGMPPERYLEGSSLGQVLTLLGCTPTAEQRIIAAADHCLAHAYAGLCPGVSPEDLAKWRVQSRSRARRLDASQLEAQISAATQALESAPKLRLANAEVAWFDAPPPEASEASARCGIPFAYVRRESDGRMKAGIMSAPAEAVREWMRRCGLKGIYGDPIRGFAGGYFPS